MKEKKKEELKKKEEEKKELKKKEEEKKPDLQNPPFDPEIPEQKQRHFR